MKAFAVALLGLGFIPSAIAGPYVSTKTEFKGNEDGYSKMGNQARIGTTFKVGSLKPYIEAGGGIVSPDGKEADTEWFVASGVGFPITDSVGAKASIKYETNEGGDNKYEFKTGLKYKF